jgi:membrane protein
MGGARPERQANAVTGRIKAGLGAVERWSQRHRSARVARRTISSFLEHEALQYAGSMAYFGVLSMFQLLVLGVVVLSIVMGEGQARTFVIDQVRAATPLDTSAIGAIIDGVIKARGDMTLVGLVFLVWGALGVFGALSSGIGRAFTGAPRRGFIEDKILGLLLLTLTGVLAVVSLAIGIVTGIVQNSAADRVSALPAGAFALSAVGIAVPFLLIFAALALIYRVVPSQRVTFGEIWPGALVAAILWTALRAAFTYYVTAIAHYDTAFGPISAAITLLVFLYFASVVLLLGAEVVRSTIDEMG